AADSRNGLEAVDYLRATRGDTNTWVIALGTNDAAFYSTTQAMSVIRTMLDRIGPGHRVIWVNIYLPKTPSWQASWNDALTRVADERPTELFVFDWASIAATRAGIMNTDRVHMTTSGYSLRSQKIAEFTRSLPDPARPVALSTPTPAADGTAGGYVSLAPSRVLDTRGGPKVASGAVVRVELGGVVPADASAVAINLTTTQADAPGYATAFPCDRAVPETSTVNYIADSTQSGSTLVFGGESHHVV
ncbi:MAG TPA: hypothetical protein PLV68_11660, partial [Ilumatobacteraceae bacterium]|nr:hypothetical protein [Ilumatobacteraceae bacterium]